MSDLRDAKARVRSVAEGATINGTYTLEEFKADLLTVLDAPSEYPTEDAYLRACRANHWRNAQLRAHGIEPIRIPDDAPQWPPEGYDFGPR